jgi:hypothetical protein
LPLLVIHLFQRLSHYLNPSPFHDVPYFMWINASQLFVKVAWMFSALLELFVKVAWMFSALF